MSYGEPVSQNELEEYFASIHSCFEFNQRLDVSSEQIVTSGVLRVLRAYRLSEDELQHVSGDDQFDTGIVTSRTSPQNNDDPEWVRLDLVNEGSSPDAVTSYILSKDTGPVAQDNERFRYSLSKILPLLEEPDDIEEHADWTAEEEAFADFIEDEAVTITAEDVAILGRLAEVLSR